MSFTILIGISIVAIGLGLLYLPDVLLPILKRYRFKNKTVIVTGGAAGIGREMSEILVNKGCNVISWDLNEPEDPISGVEYHQCNINDDSNLETLIDAFNAPSIDMIIHNAGIVAGTTLADMTRQQASRTIQTNLVSPLVISSMLLKRGVMTEDNVHVFISSASALYPPSRTIDYGASKAGIRNAAHALRNELRLLDIPGSSIAVMPFYISTGLFEGASSRGLPIMTPAYVARTIIRIVGRQAALRGGEFTIPWYLMYLCGTMPFIPTWISELIAGLLGIRTSMSNFTGRKKAE